MGLRGICCRNYKNNFGEGTLLGKFCTPPLPLCVKESGCLLGSPCFFWCPPVFPSGALALSSSWSLPCPLPLPLVSLLLVLGALLLAMPPSLLPSRLAVLPRAGPALLVALPLAWAACPVLLALTSLRLLLSSLLPLCCLPRWLLCPVCPLRVSCVWSPCRCLLSVCLLCAPTRVSVCCVGLRSARCVVPRLWLVLVRSLLVTSLVRVSALLLLVAGLLTAGSLLLLLLKALLVGLVLRSSKSAFALSCS